MISLEARLNLTRRGFLKTSAAGAMALGAGGLVRTKDAEAFAYEDRAHRYFRAPNGQIFRLAPAAEHGRGASGDTGG